MNSRMEIRLPLGHSWHVLIKFNKNGNRISSDGKVE